MIYKYEINDGSLTRIGEIPKKEFIQPMILEAVKEALLQNATEIKIKIIPKNKII